MRIFHAAAALAMITIGAARPAFADTLPAIPAAFGPTPGTLLLLVHAEGAQIYQCHGAAGSPPAWAFREPVATLLSNDKTVGRHYRGPSWSFTDGTLITASMRATAPGATPADVALLKLAVTTPPTAGPLQGATTVLRLHTVGGALSGPCQMPGALRAVAYSADYLFLR